MDSEKLKMKPLLPYSPNGDLKHETNEVGMPVHCVYVVSAWTHISGVKRPGSVIWKDINYV